MRCRSIRFKFMPRVFLVHGWEGNPKNHWFPWLERELRARYFEVYAPSMPKPGEPRLEVWVSHLADWVGKPQEDTFFVGHSLGCITVVRYLLKQPPERKVGGCVFVAGFTSSLGFNEISDFETEPHEVERARNRMNRVVCIISDMDPVVPLERATEFAKLLDAKIIIHPGKGHFTKDEGVIALPSAFKSILSFSGSDSADVLKHYSI